MQAMHASYTGRNITELLKCALEEWDIKCKDPAIVSDNTSNITIAVQLPDMLILNMTQTPLIGLQDVYSLFSSY